jgi:tripeptidyl-peptidase-1
MIHKVLRISVPAVVIVCFAVLALFPYEQQDARRHLFDNTMQLKEKIEAIPAGWHFEAPAAPDHQIELRIGLGQPAIGTAALEEKLLQTSDPGHTEYGKHLSQEEVDAHTRPSEATLSAVKTWLKQQGLTKQALRPGHDGVLTVRLSVAKAQNLLQTPFGIYVSETGQRVVRSAEYSLPLAVHEHIAFIQPTTHFGTPRTLSRVAKSRPLDTERHEGDGLVDLHCDKVITPRCLLDMYNFPNSSVQVANKSRFAIVGFLNEVANKADADLFLNRYVPELHHETGKHRNDSFHVTTLQEGPNDQSAESGTSEAALDVQYGLALAQKIPIDFISIGGRRKITEDGPKPPIDDEDEPWLELVAHLESLDADQLPQTMSISYGDWERDVPRPYMVAVCDGFMRLALRGMSILVSSGDDGVGDGSKTCGAANGTPARFLPGFPANCPYVTTVGGTVKLEEHAASFSGGGFSDHFARPLYQEDAVQEYLLHLSGKHATAFNRTGRAYPDVAAQGVNYVIYEKGKRMMTSGTSASAPTFAAAVALLNNDLMLKGKPPLGFLNPFLYGVGRTGLRDITVGRNPGCGTDGFGTAVGWDPVTGLGTPDYGALRELSMQS